MSRRSARRTPNKSLRNNESDLGESSNFGESSNRNVDENESNVSDGDLENQIGLRPVLARRSGRKSGQPDSTVQNDPTDPELVQNREEQIAEFARR